MLLVGRPPGFLLSVIRPELTDTTRGQNCCIDRFGYGAVQQFIVIESDAVNAAVFLDGQLPDSAARLCEFPLLPLQL